MNKIFLSLSIAVLAVVTAQAQHAGNVSGKQFGTAIINENVMDVKNLSQQMKTTETIESVKVTGKVVDVCQKKGCWMKLENPGGEPIHVMFKDYALFMPKDLAGQNIVLEGKAFISYTPVEELQHYAEDAGKSKEEIAKITEPKREVRIEAWGVTVTND